MADFPLMTHLTERVGYSCTSFIIIGCLISFHSAKPTQCFFAGPLPCPDTSDRNPPAININAFFYFKKNYPRNYPTRLSCGLSATPVDITAIIRASFELHIPSCIVLINHLQLLSIWTLKHTQLSLTLIKYTIEAPHSHTFIVAYCFLLLAHPCSLFPCHFFKFMIVSCLPWRLPVYWFYSFWLPFIVLFAPVSSSGCLTILYNKAASGTSPLLPHSHHFKLWVETTEQHRNPL